MLINKNFTKSVTRMAGGTFLSQLVGFLALPLLTRIYTPNDFGILASYIAINFVIISIASLRLEIAIPLAETDKEAIYLTIISFVMVIAFSILTLAYAIIIHIFLSEDALQNINKYVWLFPIGVLIGGSYNVLLNLCTRLGMFNEISNSKLYQAVIGVAVQIGMGIYSVSTYGLILGYILTTGFGSITLVKCCYSHIKKYVDTTSTIKLINTFNKYNSYPKYSTLEALTNTAGSQAPIIIIGMYLSTEAGFLMLAIKVMQAPLTLIGSSISQVFLHEAPKQYQSGKLSNLTENVLNTMTKFGVGPLLSAAIISPYVFSYIFGANWTRAGDMLILMLPWFIFQFLASPISMSMHIVGLQKNMLYLTFSGFLLRVGGVFLTAIFFEKHLTEAFAILSAIFYAVCLILFAKATGVTFNRLINILRKNILIIGTCIIISLIISSIITA